MGEVLPQGNPPKSLRGQPRTPVRLLVHEKAQRWNQYPCYYYKEEKAMVFLCPFLRRFAQKS